MKTKFSFILKTSYKHSSLTQVIDEKEVLCLIGQEELNEIKQKLMDSGSAYMRLEHKIDDTTSLVASFYQHSVACFYSQKGNSLQFGE